MTKVAILGGGVIGLSLAYEVAKRGASVTLVDKRQPGRQASWAGAGILPPANEATALHPLEQLRGISSRLHDEWAVALKAETGIDTGFRKCGGVYLARSVGEVASLLGLVDEWREFEIEIEELSRSELMERLPPLAELDSSELPRKSFWVPDEWQIRNPDHLAALRKACEELGVEFIETTDDVRLIGKSGSSTVKPGHPISCVQLRDRQIFADQFCICAGAWTENLLSPFQVTIPMTPVRGQMVLFKLPRSRFKPEIYS